MRSYQLQNRSWKFPLILSCIVYSYLPTATSFFHRNNSNRRTFRFTSSLRLMSNCGSAKRDSPSAQRNKGPILDFLSKKAFPSFLDNEMTLILEIAAGCGVHTDHFARMLAKEDTLQPFKWLPTDPEEAARASIQSYIEESELTEFCQISPSLDLERIWYSGRRHSFNARLSFGSSYLHQHDSHKSMAGDTWSNESRGRKAMRRRIPLLLWTLQRKWHSCRFEFVSCLI